MPRATTLAGLVGSLRRESIFRRLAAVLRNLAPAHLALGVVEIGDLALYNEELEGAEAPAAWLRFRSQLAASDAVLFVTPEYNHDPRRAEERHRRRLASVRPRCAGRQAGGDRRLLPGVLGGVGANPQLCQALVGLNMPVLPQPEVYLSQAAALSEDPAGQDCEAILTLLRAFLTAFIDGIERLRPSRAARLEAAE